MKPMKACDPPQDSEYLRGRGAVEQRRHAGLLGEMAGLGASG